MIWLGIILGTIIGTIIGVVVFPGCKHDWEPDHYADWVCRRCGSER